ncbi:MAG TPA: hypothetical protein VM029_19995 [Opitutaceae bacterium]|nr:hypothetical protein [Opitutaceae bacterium]
MHRLPLILCAIALLGSALSAGLYFRIGDSKQLLASRLADTSTRATKLEAELAKANEHAGALKTEAAALHSEIGALQGKLAASETRVTQLDRDLGQAKSVLSVYELTARALADEVAALRTDLSDARASNASPDAVEGYKNTIAELERQLANARNGAALPTAAGAANAVFASRVGRATVLTVGPESAFVVLNFGSVRGAQIGQKLTVSQGTEQVATVLINDVRNNFSIAHVLPDSLRGVLHKGDSAVLLR